MNLCLTNVNYKDHSYGMTFVKIKNVSWFQLKFIKLCESIIK